MKYSVFIVLKKKNKFIPAVEKLFHIPKSYADVHYHDAISVIRINMYLNLTVIPSHKPCSKIAGRLITVETNNNQEQWGSDYAFFYSMHKPATVGFD
jgi:hypothetical protein